MTIYSPFRHNVSVSTDGQPAKPVLPVDVDNIFASASVIATAAAADVEAYETEKVDVPKKNASLASATALATLVNQPTASDAIAVSVDPNENYASVSSRVANVFNIVQHPGYGSGVVRVNAFMAVEGNVFVQAEAWVDEDSSTQIDVSAVVTEYADRIEDNSCVCEATVAVETIYTVDYRWGTDTTVEHFYPSGVNNPFPFVRGQVYILAVRFRVGVDVVIQPSELVIQFAHSSTPNDWEMMNFGTDVAFANTVNYWRQTTLPAEVIPTARFVTRKGPGNPTVVDGIFAHTDEQAPLITPETTNITEFEVQFPVTILLGSPTGNYYLRVVSVEDRAIVRPYNHIMSQPWITGVI